MGSACCVAARDKTITNGSSSEILQRNARYSPSWSFRWDNRGRVVGEETSVNWFSDVGSRNDGLDVKSGTTGETTFASEEGSPLDSSRTIAWQKSPVFYGNTGILRLPPSDPSMSGNSAAVKESMGSPAVSDLSPMKLSPSVQSLSSMSTSPLSSKSQLPLATSTTPRWPRSSPSHQHFRQISDTRIPGSKSPNLSISEEPSSFMLPGWSNESIRSSHGGSSDTWSIPPFSDFMATAQKERWSFDSESFGYSCEKLSRSSGPMSVSASFDIHICGICSRLLTEKSSWGGQKLIATNEIAVAAVLICGHVYHAECLENMTPEINKYDPACPVCTYGEKQAMKISEKALKTEIELRAKNSKKSRNRVVDSDLDTDFVVFDRQKSAGVDGRGSKSSSNSCMKSSLGRPFLRQHFSFGSKESRSMSENHSTTRKKGFFWTKSSKM